MPPSWVQGQPGPILLPHGHSLWVFLSCCLHAGWSHLDASQPDLMQTEFAHEEANKYINIYANKPRQGLSSAKSLRSPGLAGWLCWLEHRPKHKRLQFGFPVRAHMYTAGSIPSQAAHRGNQWMVLFHISLSPCLSLSNQFKHTHTQHIPG